MNIAYNMDCMEYMRTLPDKAFDLAVVDPPYGFEKGKATSRIAKYGQMQTVNDAKPSTAYFAELRRISKNQIIWGYNHLGIQSFVGSAPANQRIYFLVQAPACRYILGWRIGMDKWDENGKML